MIYSKNPEYKKMICERKSTDYDDTANFEYFKKSFIIKKFFKILIECENSFEAKRRQLVIAPNFCLFEIFDKIKKEGEIVLFHDDVQLFYRLDLPLH